MPAASSATSVTSASPIISAAAVDAVRCGLRRALSRASQPAVPPTFVAGQPRAHASGRMNRTESIETPTKISERADAHPDEHALRPEVLAEQAVEQRREPGRGDDRRADGAEPREPRRRQRRSLANRCDRRHARGADRRPQARDQRDDHADDHRDDRRPRREDDAAVRQREADRVEQLEEPLGEAEAEEQPDDGRSRADHERLDDDRAQHLAARRTHRAVGRELARALRDRDRERVRDHEAADEQRDAAEREQEAAQERDEASSCPSRPRPPVARRSAPGRWPAGPRAPP